MLLHKSFILIGIALFYVTSSLSHPTTDRNTVMNKHRRLKRRSPKPSIGNTNNKNKRKKVMVIDEDRECLSDFCANVSSYPTEKINKLLKEQHFPKMEFFLKKYEDLKPMERSMAYDESLCEVISKTIEPRCGLSMRTKQKEYIVQGDTAKQSVYMEKCRSDKPRLHLDCLPDGYSAVRCVQQFREIPLLTFNEKTKTIIRDSYKVPSGCSVEYKRIKVTPVPF